MKTATVLLFLAVATISGDSTVPRTAGFVNGRTWRDMPYQSKVTFILGFEEGIRVPTINKVAETAAYVKVFLGHSQFGGIVAGVDDFYRDPANLQIQVINAMKYFQEKVNRASPESLAKDLADYRKFAANHVDK